MFGSSATGAFQPGVSEAEHFRTLKLGIKSKPPQRDSEPLHRGDFVSETGEGRLPGLGGPLMLPSSAEDEASIQARRS